ncbi:MAG: hypothetical protein IJX51_06605 [Clostridia bacterium]|nr:hypothetical protein [Clostridia bacterium]
MKQDEIPVGFAMSLAMNSETMQKFATLSEEQKKEVIRGTHNVKSREEMHRYVDSLVNRR